MSLTLPMPTHLNLHTNRVLITVNIILRQIPQPCCPILLCRNSGAASGWADHSTTQPASPLVCFLLVSCRHHPVTGTRNLGVIQVSCFSYNYSFWHPIITTSCQIYFLNLFSSPPSRLCLASDISPLHFFTSFWTDLVVPISPCLPPIHPLHCS